MPPHCYTAHSKLFVGKQNRKTLTLLFRMNKGIRQFESDCQKWLQSDASGIQNIDATSTTTDEDEYSLIHTSINNQNYASPENR